MSEENKTPEPKPGWMASFDARDWAKEFLRSCEQSPLVGAVAPDEETMVGWFANALMRGYDEHRWKAERESREPSRCVPPSPCAPGPAPVPGSRSDLESKVRIGWERLNGRTDRCVGTLEASSDCHVDRAVAALAGMPEERLRAAIESEVRRRLVSSVLGGLESERARLRVAIEKWGRRAISRQFPSRERRNEQDTEENELKEDLK